MTKIQPEDLPEWYVYGRYYRKFGYLSTKGITDMVYKPNLWINHFLRDDFLYISYGGKITKAAEDNKYEYYEGYDVLVYGLEIIDILKGARKYSNYDITPIIEQIKEKKKILQENHPEEFGADKWDFNVDGCFKKELDTYRYHMPEFAKQVRRENREKKI